MQQRWICFQKWLTPFDSMVTKFVTFSPKNHPHRLHSQWRNSLTGWTFSKIYVIQSGFDGSRNTPKRTGKFRRATEICTKNEGGYNVARPLRRSRVKREYYTSCWLIYMHCRFTVAEWLTHWAATLGHGLAPQRYFWDLFSRIDTVSGTEGLKMICVTL